MTEATQVWAVCRKHVAPYGRWKRIEDRLEAGVPDVSYTLLRPYGRQGWLELKLFRDENRCPYHFTLEQLMWGEAEEAAGGNWHLLGRCGSTWLMYDVVEARILFEGGQATPCFRISGRFPLRELLLELAR